MSGLSIRLAGYPEKVQQVADVIEAAFPGLISWVQAFEDTEEITIAIEGCENPIMSSQTFGQALLKRNRYKRSTCDHVKCALPRLTGRPATTSLPDPTSSSAPPG